MIFQQSAFQAFMEDNDCDIETMPPDIFEEDFEDCVPEAEFEEDFADLVSDDWTWLM